MSGLDERPVRKDWDFLDVVRYKILLSRPWCDSCGSSRFDFIEVPSQESTLRSLRVICERCKHETLVGIAYAGSNGRVMDWENL